jgi:pheromone a factor receptor
MSTMGFFIPIPPQYPALSSYPLPVSSVLLPLFGLTSLILQIPPLIFHIYQRNLGASALIIWLSLSLLIVVCNALIWPRDNIQDWWDGAGYCDVVIRIQIGAQAGLPGSALVIARGLAAILHVDEAPRVRKWWTKALEWWLCLGFPLFLMAVYYIVQSNRYSLATTSGCQLWLDRNWVSIVLVEMWPLVLSIYNAYLGSKSFVTCHVVVI